MRKYDSFQCQIAFLKVEFLTTQGRAALLAELDGSIKHTQALNVKCWCAGGVSFFQIKIYNSTNACAEVNWAKRLEFSVGFVSVAQAKAAFSQRSFDFFSPSDGCMFSVFGLNKWIKYRQCFNNFLTEWCGGVPQDFLSTSKLLRRLAAGARWRDLLQEMQT